MERSLFKTAIQSIRRTARMLMHLQSRAESFGTAYVDPRQFSDYMRRDLGLLDGHEGRLERLPRSVAHAPEEAGTLTRLYVTPHAS